MWGESPRPEHNLYYLVYLGAIDLERATEKLLQKHIVGNRSLWGNLGHMKLISKYVQ